MLKKIGKQVLFLKTNDECPRNGEGSFIRLKTGGILFAYTRYNGKKSEDDSPADIYGIISDDEGENWSEPFPVIKSEKDAKNVMSVSLLRMKNDDIGLFYTKKYTDGKCILMLERSENEGKTWSKAVRCIDKDDYFVTNNDRVIMLKSGRILAPGNLHELDNDRKPSKTGQQCCFASDDDGYTWFELSQRVKIPFPDTGFGIGIQETGFYQFKNEEVWAYSRTEFGMQYECFSKNDGNTWSAVQPNTFFTSPVSPMLIKRSGEYTIAVYNPVPWNVISDNPLWKGRTPYVCAVSTDDGRTFSSKNVFYLEDDLSNQYCYPAIIEVENGFLVAYYHSDGREDILNALKITKISFEELDVH